ncbi:MAG: hypothetical protein A2Y65_06545 [Deltaproteobacteria bacterium RBG_13_52_11]|nr:MAG: hypothetical protein A2Y65_06545 [Deltaproteobacteria bacterium RBG_13_52_11]
MGAGHLCQIEMEGKADSRQTYRALALSRKELVADIILCGKEFLDYKNGQVGAFGEHHLGSPFVR